MMTILTRSNRNKFMLNYVCFFLILLSVTKIPVAVVVAAKSPERRRTTTTAAFQLKSTFPIKNSASATPIRTVFKERIHRASFDAQTSSKDINNISNKLLTTLSYIEQIQHMSQDIIALQRLCLTLFDILSRMDTNAKILVRILPHPTTISSTSTASSTNPSSGVGVGVGVGVGSDVLPPPLPPFERLRLPIEALLGYRRDVTRIMNALDSKLFDNIGYRGTMNRNVVTKQSSLSVKRAKTVGLLPKIGHASVMIRTVHSSLVTSSTSVLKDTSNICSKIIQHMDIVPLQTGFGGDGGDFLHEMEWNLRQEKLLLERTIPPIDDATSYLRTLLSRYHSYITTLTSKLHATLDMLLPLDTFMIQFIEYIGGPIYHSDHKEWSRWFFGIEQQQQGSGIQYSNRYNKDGKGIKNIDPDDIQWVTPKKILKQIDYVIRNIENPFIDPNSNNNNEDDETAPQTILPMIQTLIEKLTTDEGDMKQKQKQQKQDPSSPDTTTTGTTKNIKIDTIDIMNVNLENLINMAYIDNLRFIVRHRMKLVLKDVVRSLELWQDRRTYKLLCFVLAIILLPEIIANIYFYLLNYGPTLVANVLRFLQDLANVGR